MRLLFPVFAAALLAGCVAPVGPVEVTRFHVADVNALARGPISVEPAAGFGDTSLELRTYQAAVARELIRHGYAEAAPGAARVAQVRLSRRTWEPGRRRGPVSVGVGAGGGSWGSGAGVGVGLDLSPKPGPQVETELAVAIKGRASGRNLWEGRAIFVVDAGSPLAQTDLGAAKLAEALFRASPATRVKLFW